MLALKLIWGAVTSRAGLLFLKVAGIAIAVGTILLKARQSGRDAERVDHMERSLDTVEKANAAKRDVDAAHARGDVPERVRKFYID